jgi:hypothetical protein
MHAQIRATQGSYTLSPLFIYAHPIKIKPGVGRTSLYSHLVMGQSALAETGAGETAPMPPQKELARADLGPGCPRRRGAQRGTRSGRATLSSFYSLFVSERRTLRIDRAAIARRPGSISSFP